MQNSIKAIILVVLKTNSFVQKYKYFYLYGIIFCIKTCPGLVSNMLYYNVLPVYARAKICPLFCCIEITFNFYIKAPVFCEVFFAPKMARLNNGNCEI